MIINEELLQFYSFALDKDVKTLFCFVEKECKKENIILKLSNNKHCHEILGDNKHLLIKIINKCYKPLYKSLLQKFECINGNKGVLNSKTFINVL